MNATTLIILFAVAVAGAVLLLILSQGKEKARLEVARKVTALEDEYRRCYRLLTEIPERYITRDISLMLLDRMEGACQQLQQLKNDLPVDQWLAEISVKRETLAKPAEPSGNGAVTNPEQANIVREHLKSLYRLIENLASQKQLPGASAKQLMARVVYLGHQIQADIHVAKAQELIRNQQYQRAGQFYKLAIAELKPYGNTPEAAAVISRLEARLQEMDALIAQSNGAKSENADDASKLDEQWDSFLKKDDDWKKKADYDD